MTSLLPGITCVLLSLLLTAAISSQGAKHSAKAAIGKKSHHVKCRSDYECKRPTNRCHKRLRVCFRAHENTKEHKEARSQCLPNSKCGNGKICHPIFHICVRNKTNQQVKTAPPKQRKVRVCSTTDDCKLGQFCSEYFNICVDIRKTYANAYKSVPKTLPTKCTNNSDCPSEKYCHQMHGLCLPQVITPTKSVSQNAPKKCESNRDCSTGEYCHEYHMMCLKSLPLEPSIGTTEYPIDQVTECNDEKDCKDTETCHLFPRGPRSRRRLARVACHDVPNSSAGCTRQIFHGICINKELLDSLRGQGNCSNHTDCGANMCCIRSKGVCLDHRRRGEMCVIQDVWFSCPCAKGLTCVSRGRGVNARKLAERLQLPSQLIKPLTNKETKRKRYEVGKCE